MDFNVVMLDCLIERFLKDKSYRYLDLTDSGFTPIQVYEALQRFGYKHSHTHYDDAYSILTMEMCNQEQHLKIEANIFSFSLELSYA